MAVSFGSLNKDLKRVTEFCMAKEAGFEYFILSSGITDSNSRQVIQGNFPIHNFHPFVGII